MNGLSNLDETYTNNIQHYNCPYTDDVRHRSMQISVLRKRKRRQGGSGDGDAEVEAPLIGGSWRPSNCSSRHRIAVVVPYRDRQRHLRVFLRYMHPFLQRQMLDYAIYVVEQVSRRLH